MDVQLFGVRLSPFVEKVARALQVKGIPFSMIGFSSPNDFKKQNPATQKMPVLIVDGERTFDSTVILRKIEQLAPEPPLLDADPKVAALQTFLEDWSDESLYWYQMAFRWADVNTDATATQVASGLPVPSFLLPIMKMILTRQIKGQAAAQGLQRLPFDVLSDEFGRRLDELVVMLGDRPFFYADKPSVADLALFGQFNTLRSGPTPQAEKLVQARPTLVAWRERVDAATSDNAAAAPKLAAVGG